MPSIGGASVEVACGRGSRKVDQWFRWLGCRLYLVPALTVRLQSILTPKLSVVVRAHRPLLLAELM